MYMVTIPRSPRAQRVHPTACQESASITPQSLQVSRLSCILNMLNFDGNATGPRTHLVCLLTCAIGEREQKGKKSRKRRKQKKKRKGGKKTQSGKKKKNTESKTQVYSFAIHPKLAVEN